MSRSIAALRRQGLVARTVEGQHVITGAGRTEAWNRLLRLEAILLLTARKASALAGTLAHA